jgi:hypothetical protein
MSFKINDKEFNCAHGCTSLIEHTKTIEAEDYVSRFENKFEEYVNGIASVIYLNDASQAKPIVQSLIDSYHYLNRDISPLSVKNFATLQMFVKITGANWDPI